MTPNLTHPELRRGCQQYRKLEKRDPMYRVASFLISSFWGDTGKTTDGLGVLLLTWNQAFYRYGAPDFELLERCLLKWEKTLGDFRSRKLEAFSPTTASSEIQKLFHDFLEALRGRAGARSPVAVAKALHLLAPEFFPLWDIEIAKGYECKWKSSAVAAGSYLNFMVAMQELLASLVTDYTKTNGVAPEVATDFIVKDCSPAHEPRTILKLVDEYNFVKFTKKVPGF